MGRDAEITTLHNLLQQETPVEICAVSGMGGIGKTELALQYALKHRDLGTYPGGICWLRARQEVKTQLVDFARSPLGLNLPLDLELEAKVRQCWQDWRNGETLIIFDDVQHYDDIKDALPPGRSRFKVLLTTRSRLEEDHLRRLDLDFLPPLDAFKLLYVTSEAESRLLDAQPIAEELCAWLGYLPLGIKLVAKFLKIEPDWSLQTMLMRLQTEQLQQDALSPIDAVFALSWQALIATEQQLAALLSLFAATPLEWALVERVVSLCEVKPTPPTLLQRVQSLWKPPLPPEQWCLLCEPKALEQGRRRLVELSLLQRVGTELYQLHPLLRSFFAAKREPMADATAMKQAFCQAMVAVAQQIPQMLTLSLIAQVTPAIPHLKEAATTFSLSLTDADLITPSVGISRFYEGQAAYAEAEEWYEQCQAIATQRLGADHPAVATSLNNLAELYYAQGRYAEAEPLYTRALEIWERQLGADHPAVATSLNNLAELYYAQGRYAEAEPRYTRALEIWERQLGADHPAVATSLNNLAELYYAQGRYAEAEPLYTRALEIWERQLGADHPAVATSLNNLAGLYRAQGRYAEAEPLFTRALEIKERQLGADHPAVATSLNNLAGLYYAQGRYAEAEPRYLRALAILFKALGADHPNTQTVRQNFLGLFQQVVQAGETAQLSDHPMTQDLLRQIGEAST